MLTTKITVDNAFTAYLATSNTVQGVQFSSGTDWNTVTTGSVELSGAAQYYLHISATDAGGVAGMLAQFSLANSGYHFADNSTSLLSGSSLILANAIGYTSAFSAATVWGTNGIGPWGTVASIGSTAQWIWSGNNDSNNFSYFTFAILKDAPANVPEPASLGLMGLGLLALARFKAKSR